MMDNGILGAYPSIPAEILGRINGGFGFLTTEFSTCQWRWCATTFGGSDSRHGA